MPHTTRYLLDKFRERAKINEKQFIPIYNVIMIENVLYHSLLVCDFKLLRDSTCLGSQTLQPRIPRWDSRSSYRYLWQWLPEDLVAVDAWGCKSGPGLCGMLR